MDIWGFIKKYYIDSIVYKEGYNIVNTLTWALILVLAVYFLYKFLQKRTDFRSEFVISMLPFIVFGSSVRIVEDAGFIDPPISYFLMTPFIYFLTFFVAFPSLLLSIKLKNYKVCTLLGVLLSSAVLIFLFSNLKVVHYWVFPAALAMSFLVSYVFSFVTKKSFVVMFSHMLDSFSSYIGIKFLNYWELHVLPRFLVENFGSEVLPLVKFLVLASVLYILDFEKDEKLKNFLKFCLIVLGLAPGIRNSLRMTFEV
ncbi:MAG: DUF63 family protein [Archaeoglobaceae archaeon]|nr:DUF63 family protein [Archaeoglobaceae archaeon]MCX8151984.1 DUF63 family protein [Archaeoglobaceae archaeon]MDW8013373.1 DUF63 family protein [Archaeoglobaceae archaeon]